MRVAASDHGSGRSFGLFGLLVLLVVSMPAYDSMGRCLLKRPRREKQIGESSSAATDCFRKLEAGGVEVCHTSHQRSFKVYA